MLGEKSPRRFESFRLRNTKKEGVLALLLGICDGTDSNAGTRTYLKNSSPGSFGADRILHFVQDDKKVSLCHLFVISAALSFRGEAEESFLLLSRRQDPSLHSG